MAFKFPHVAVLMGGISPEREGSLIMGEATSAALREAGYRVTEIDPSLETVIDDLRAAKPDAVFNALMGHFGEDGAIQGLLEWLKIPYTHSGVTASAIGMDKSLSRHVFAAHGLPVPEGRSFHRNALLQGHPLPPPYVLKPNCDGSSFGVILVEDGDPVPDPKDHAASLLAENYIPGRDFTVSVIADTAFEISEVVLPGKIYDTHAKFVAEGVELIVAPDMPPEINRLCRNYAEAAHRALGCRYISRLDLRWDESRGADGLHVLEINTQPGFGREKTSIRQHLKRHNRGFAEFCAGILEDASLSR